MFLDRLLAFLKTREFIARLVTFIVFILVSLNFDFAKDLDTTQITDLILAIIGALVVFDPWKLISVFLEFFGILQND